MKSVFESAHFDYLITVGVLTVLIIGFSPPDPFVQVRNAAIALPIVLAISYLYIYKEGYKRLKQFVR